MSKNLAELIDETCRRYGEKPAFSCLGREMSFSEVDRHARAFGAWLQHNTDLQPGERIAIQLPNVLAYPVAAYGAIYAGLVLVNTNPLYTKREMQHQFADSGARALVVLKDIAPSAEAILADTDIQTVITAPAMFTDQPGDAPGNAVDFGRVLTEGASLELREDGKQRGSAELAALQYTGGTTGVAKGAMLSHANITANVDQVYDHFGRFIHEGEEIFVAPLPLYHIYAFTVNMLMFFNFGGLNVLIPNPRDLDQFVQQIKPYRFTGFAGLNTLFVGLCHHPEFQELDFSALRLTVSGGTATTMAAANAWEKTTGCRISEGWGLSETSPVLTINPPDAQQLGTIGVPLKDTEIIAVREDGQRAGVGEPGELWARGPQVMQGYWNRPEATDEVLTSDGFFKTGDIGLIQEDGYIRIVDRKKDMILVGGFNVFPNEVENVLTQHPKVMECAVVGVPDERSGEVVRAYVVPAEPDFDDASELERHCRESLTAYKVPKQIIFREALPKSAVGKVLRKDLRAEAESEAANG
ncbi:AMP-binding protein [Ectothiorhodospiraceae bacterium WFHF3C12]|nr:AMP-binding protein [Ectothiorhodospiraceae bacterium WFHF3C12]